VATNPERSAEEKAADRAIDQEPNDKSAAIEGDITADAADRFAETIRPSWVQLGPTQSVQKDAAALEQVSSKGPDVTPVVPQSGSIREDTDAELKLAAATTIRPVKKVRKKTLLWAGGVAACFFALIAFSVTTQKEQETSLWESEKIDRPASVQSVPKEKFAKAKSVAKVESEPREKSFVEPSTSAINSPANREEEPLSASETKVSTASSQAAEQPLAKPIAEESEQQATAPQKVRIRVKTIPATAELTLDGSSVPNPFDQLLPKNGEHLFVAEASGYLKKYRRVAFDRNKELSMQLAPIKRKSRASRGTATKTASRRKSAKKASRRTSKPRRAASRAKSSRKSFISENPY
jgi:hypothetical protein